MIEGQYWYHHKHGTRDKLEVEEPVRAYIVDDATLREMAPLSLKERCKIIETKFDINLSVKKLRKIYDDHKISKNKIKVKNANKMKYPENIVEEMRTKVNEEVTELTARGYDIW